MTAEQRKETWYAVTVTLDRVAELAIDTAFGILNSGGTEVDTLGKKDTETIQVTGYFDAAPDKDLISRVISQSLANHSIEPTAVKGFTVEEVVEKDWLEEWKKYWKPTTVARFIIAPPWETIAETEKIVIRIEPQMAFGTGTHETTKLCLKFIDQKFDPQMSFLDVGTGTGILSIAAAKMAPDISKSFDALDTDAASVGIARENARLNNTPDIGFAEGSISESTSMYQFVCANMTIDIIRPMLELLVKKAEQVLVLSGILVEQEKEIVGLLKKLGTPKPEIIREGEWIALAIEF